MEGKMRAVYKMENGPGNMEVKEVDIPKPGEGDVLIKIKAVGVCGTDSYIWKGQLDLNTPIIMGHEFSGQIVEVGSKVKHFKTGDRVVAETRVDHCNVCKMCYMGYTNFCNEKIAPGFEIDGFYGEYIALPEALCHIIPDNITFEEAALMEPAAVVTTGLLEFCTIEPEDVVVVIGAGPVGLIALQMAKLHAAKVIMIAFEKYGKLRYEKVKEIGADIIIDDPDADVKAIVDSFTKNLGADVVCDCTGTEAGVNLALDILRKRGRFSWVGYPHGEITLDGKKAVYKAINIVGTYGSTALSWEKTISMVARGAVDLKGLITHKEPLENYEEIYKETEKMNIIKGILLPEKTI